MSAVDSLQSTLAAEHAAVWLYGVLAAQASAPGRTGAPARRLAAETATAFATHRSRRDQLERWLRDREVTPATAEAAYVIPDGTDDVAGLRRAALGIERAAATAYADLVAHTTGSEREWAIGALTDAAARELAFRGTPENFPGLGELAGH